MRIGTWNVDYARSSHLEALRRQLDKHPADICVLTETNDDLRPEGHVHRRSTPTRPKTEAPGAVRAGSHWVSISSHLAMSDIPGFIPHDPQRTLAVAIDLGDSLQWPTAIVYGTVLPEGSNEEFERAVNEQAEEWAFLKSELPDALFCIAGDFNTDLGAAPQFNLPRFYRSKFGPETLQPIFAGLDLTCATDREFPDGNDLKFPPIDHIVLPTSVAASTKISCLWAGRKGISVKPEVRIGIVVEVEPREIGGALLAD